MCSLGDICRISENIKSAPSTVVKKFYKLIFEHECDGRTVRKKLKDFSGFDFDIGSERFKAKLQYASENFTINDLTSFANLLHVDYDTTKTELINKICICLTDLNTLQNIFQDELEDDAEDDGSDVEEIDDVRRNQRMSEDIRSVASSHSHTPQFSMSFRDIEESVKIFDGTKTYPVEKWIADVARYV